MFVQTWLKLQQMLREKASMAVLGPWIIELMQKIINFGLACDEPTFAESGMLPILLGYIRKWEQGKIMGRTLNWQPWA